MKLERLRTLGALNELAYHLEGIVEAAAGVERLARELDASSSLDNEQVAKILAELEIDAFFHIDYHQKELRKPLRDLVRLVHRNLGATQRGKSPVKKDKEFSSTVLSKRQAKC